MDKKALQTYATWSKQYLEQQIELSLKSLGIHGDDDIREAKKVGDVTIIDGDSASYPAELKSQRDDIIRLIKTAGYNNTVETFAYTWFNRIIALRFMEIHGFLPHGFRVLSDASGGIEPEIIKNLSFVKSELSLDMDVCASLKEKNDIDALFRYVLFHQCNSLSGILPMLFDSEESYLELLLPKSLLKGDTVITRLLDIPEEVFLDDVEVIGWLYQYYVSGKKDKVFAELKKNIKISSENIPAATQLFTPDWIVRYMVENSLGRIWLESFPYSTLKSEMKYYIEEAEQESDLERVLQDARCHNVNLEELRILEPCCGSGHILVYIFDLLYKMYEEKGYLPREIPTLILSKNLYGLEVDKRASQLASFALVMRARGINNRFFDEKNYVRPQVFEIYDSKELIENHYLDQLNETSISQFEKQEIIKLVDIFEEAKSIGSLTNVTELDFSLLDSALEHLKNEVLTTFNVQLINNGCKLISKLIAQAKVMGSKYDLCITNPPYMGSSGMNNSLAEYVKECFPNSKSDLFACFIEKGFAFSKPNAFISMVTMQSWMFLSSFEKFRSEILHHSIYNLIRIGYNSFPELNSQVAHACAFVFRKTTLSGYLGTYFELNTGKSTDDKNQVLLQRMKDGEYYVCSNEQYQAIPGSPIAFWMSAKMYDTFKNPNIGHYASTNNGFTTGNNDLFIRLWHEVNVESICFDNPSIDSLESCDKKWFPYNKGGDFRKWYGNNEYIINWENNGDSIKKYGHLVPRSMKYQFNESASWNKINTDSNGFRYKPVGTMFDVGGLSMFSVPHDQLIYLLALCNSVYAQKVLEIISPTVNCETGHVSSIPVIIHNKDKVVKLSEENIRISRQDWDSFETSWDFKHHPFMLTNDIKKEALTSQFAEDRLHCLSLLSWQYRRWEDDCEFRFNSLKGNEEELNRIFIDAYGLQEELIPDVPDRVVTVRKADIQRDIKSFISYLIGIVMGRYSLDVPGLAYAGGDWDDSKYRLYQPDDDGIVPIYVGVGMQDGLTARIAELVKLIYGEETYKENIDFIADALGKTNSESSLETLNRYLNDGFYADHLKIYQKRPVYWMFSSGKQKGFKCLVYVHRYNKDTLARINAKYYLPESTRQKISLEELEEQIKTADGKERIHLEKNRQKLFDKYNETIEYGQVLDHMANKYIDIDLDDGVKVNYAKFQGVELVSDSGVKIKKDLLVPLK